MTARLRARALGAGRGDGRGIAIPLALRPAARIQERDWEDFTQDPTQLANGLRDLYDAIQPDGLAVTSAQLLTEQAGTSITAGTHGRAAVEAARRLRSSLGDRAALVACLPGPEPLAAATGLTAEAAVEQVLSIGKEFLGAGVDVLLLFEGDDGSPQALNTLNNIARFHQAVVAVAGEARSPFLGARPSSLQDPQTAPGLVISDCEITRAVDITDLKDWVIAVRA